MEKLLGGLRAVAEHTRLRLLAILFRNELTVSEITYILDQSQPRVSRHLKLMCDAGILDRIQEGAWVFYRVTDKQPGRQLSQALIELLDNDDVLQRDETRMQQIRQEHRQQAESYFQEMPNNGMNCAAFMFLRKKLNKLCLTL